MDIGIVQKRIEDTIFGFIETDLKNISIPNISARTIVYNEVVNLVEKIIPMTQDISQDDLETELEEAEESLDNVCNSFDNLKDDATDALSEIRDRIDDILEKSKFADAFKDLKALRDFVDDQYLDIQAAEKDY